MVRLFVAMVAVSFMATSPTIESYPKFVELIPNGGNVPDVPNIGHLDPAGESGVSKFGEAFSKAHNSWVALLCQKDTDGDGYTNGQELGDPCCTWTQTNTVDLITDGVSDPSDASKIPTNIELLAGCKSSGNVSTTISGDMADMVGTVIAANSISDEMPPDDDEDDASESAVLTAGTSMTAISHVTMGLIVVVAIALAW